MRKRGRRKAKNAARRRKEQVAGERRAPISLVTGASGRLGRHLVPALLAMGERVRVLHRRSEKPPSYPEGVEVVFGDITDRSSLEAAVADVDYVYHLAAIVSHSAPPEVLLEVNYEGTRNLLDACARKAYSLKRFIYVSSISVYGKKPAALPANEETPLNPSDWYGKTKAMAEEAVMQYAGRMPVVILRPAVIYGEGFDEAYLPVLAALEKGRMQIIGSGQNVIPFVHVKDVVRALILASRAEKAPGNVYIIASPERMTQRDILRIACRSLGVPFPRSSVPVWVAMLRLMLANIMSALAGGKPKLLEEHLDTISANRYFDVSKAERELGFRASVKLEDGIKEMVEYYRRKVVSHEDWKDREIHQ